MASHRLSPRYAIKECSTCGKLYTKECCLLGNLEDKILVPKPDSSPRCARCGTPVDGPSCRMDVHFYERNSMKICLRIVLKMEFSKIFEILPSHPMTIPTLLMLLESQALLIKTP
ncbi:hypothetical protein Tco_0176297, partial [Tanacetum coccineum]